MIAHEVNELFAQETLDGGHNTGDPELVDFRCDHSAGTIDWLDGLGIRLDNSTLKAIGLNTVLKVCLYLVLIT